MADPNLDTIDERVLAIVRSENKEMSPAEIITAVTEDFDKVTDVDVKRALWRLISQNELEFSSDQLVRVAPVAIRNQRR